MPAPPYPVATLIALACERIVRLIQSPANPFPEGATPSEWARAIGLGLGVQPRAELGQLDPIDIGPHDAESLALLACRRLAQRGTVAKVRARPVYVGRRR